MDVSKIVMVGAVLSLAVLPLAASAAAPQQPAASPAQLQVSDAQLHARAEGVELIQARWYHHRHYWGYRYYRPYYWGYYHHRHHHYWR